MVASYRIAAFGIYGSNYAVVNREASLFNRSEVGENAAGGFLCIGYAEFRTVGCYNAGIAYLTAALAVERGFIKNDNRLYAVRGTRAMI